MAWIIVSDYDLLTVHRNGAVVPVFRSIHGRAGTEERKQALLFASRKQAEQACEAGEHVERTRPKREVVTIGARS